MDLIRSQFSGCSSLWGSVMKRKLTAMCAIFSFIFLVALQSQASVSPFGALSKNPKFPKKDKMKLTIVNDSSYTLYLVGIKGTQNIHNLRLSKSAVKPHGKVHLKGYVYVAPYLHRGLFAVVYFKINGHVYPFVVEDYLFEQYVYPTAGFSPSQNPIVGSVLYSVWNKKHVHDYDIQMKKGLVNVFDKIQGHVQDSRI